MTTISNNRNYLRAKLRESAFVTMLTSFTMWASLMRLSWNLVSSVGNLVRSYTWVAHYGFITSSDRTSFRLWRTILNSHLIVQHVEWARHDHFFFFSLYFKTIYKMHESHTSIFARSQFIYLSICMILTLLIHSNWIFGPIGDEEIFQFQLWFAPFQIQFQLENSHEKKNSLLLHK